MNQEKISFFKSLQVLFARLFEGRVHFLKRYLGKIRKAGADPSYPLIAEDGPAYVPAKGWAEMIHKVYEVDPLRCPTCGGQMSIISFIEEPKTIDRIIGHLKLTF